MKLWILSSSLVLSALVGANAVAAVHLEPFLGYLIGETNHSPKRDVKGTDMGARVGYRQLGLALGGEISLSDFTIDANPDYSFDPMNLGAFVAYEFPILIRVYGTYILASKGDTSGGEYSDGTGYRLGVGYTGLPFVAINFEMTHLEYDKYKSGGTTVGSDFEMDMYGLFVSVPLSL